MKQTLTFITACLLMLVAYTSKAQDSDDETQTKLKSYVGISMGISKPFGDFAKHDYYNNKAGFAGTAVAYSIDGAVYVHKNWGVGYTLSFQDQGNLNGTDDQQLTDGFEKDLNADVVTISADKRYRSYNLLVGPQYTYQWRRLSFDARISAGVIKSKTSPQLDYSIIYNGVPEITNSFSQESSKATAFAYGASAAIRFNMGAGWGLSLKGNYINSDGLKIVTSGTVSNNARVVTKQPITEGQVFFGLLKAF